MLYLDFQPNTANVRLILTVTMVNWKDSDATDRLFAALIAAHPDLRVSIYLCHESDSFYGLLFSFVSDGYTLIARL